MRKHQAVFDGNTGKFYRNIVKNSEYSDFIICKIEVNDAEKNRLEIEFREQDNFKIMTFDIIRQKNISKMSNKLD